MVKVLDAGFFTTIQDSGRFGFRNKGVPVAGTMDDVSAERANNLLENKSSDALLEITMKGPKLAFEKPSYICLSGAILSASLNEEPIVNHQIVKVEEGDVLSFGKLDRGLRLYLGIKGGFKTEKVLGSRSFYYPITEKSCLAEHDQVPYEEVIAFQPKISEAKFDNYLTDEVLEIQKGPEFGLLSGDDLGQLLSKPFTVAKENNRMAYQLNEKISGHAFTMLTSATLPGTVQLTPSGKLIILMKDGQTTGGYPRILQLTKRSIAVLAQKRFGDQVQFRLV
ncbi:biotin-dependent carboxyltransferase family protein [Flagellimonas lutaonensis]|uniref:Allophanate hydrolase n=1 Tax=Flagellimonas lutaonensis TaxID=516051 RepID=A0A0D5YX37_9FLAO|nr:biotin-dependent carboxyltransferase family protein [Allomuricauda lutaonensis]AKA36471.1 allophanate hydrolase [Allomuricauda lutaonensis]